MIYISSLEKTPADEARDLLSVSKTSLDVCPETARAAEFLSLMDGWL